MVLNISSQCYQKIIDKMYGLIIIDTNYKVMFLEENYAKLLGIPLEKAINTDIFKLLPDTRLHTVIETGTPILGEVFYWGGLKFTCNRYPLIENGKIIGAFAHWTDMSGQLLEFIEELKDKIKFYSQWREDKKSTSYYSLENIIGNSIATKHLHSVIIAASLSNSTVLVQGETGTGKELVAHSIHRESNRSTGPFIKVNCAAIPAELVESELFGYVDGAFTGARKQGFEGKFSQANGGTLFLDEISQLSLPAQAKILRAIQEKEVSPLGSDKTVKIDIRIIACSNEDLKKQVEKKLFRSDLFYRLNVIPIEVPALRDRLDDIKELVDFFVKKYANLMGITRMQVDPNVYQLLSQYDWPGNIRELEHAIERVINLTRSPIITENHFNWLMINPTRDANHSKLQEQLALLEIRLIKEALEKVQGNKKKASEILGITRPLLYKKMKRLNISIYQHNEIYD